MWLFGTESQRLELLRPFGRRIAESLDTDATGQATFHGCFDKTGCEEGERDRHVDLPNATLLARAKFGDVGYSTRDDILQPSAAFGDGADQTCPALELLRLDVAPRRIVRQQDPAGSLRRRFVPRDCEQRLIIQAIRFFVCPIRLKSND